MSHDRKSFVDTKKDSIIRSMLESKRLMEARLKNLEEELNEAKNALEAAQEAAKGEQEFIQELEAENKVLNEKLAKMQLEQIRPSSGSSISGSSSSSNSKNQDQASQKEIATLKKSIQKRDVLISTLQQQLKVLKEENDELVKQLALFDEDNSDEDDSCR